MKANGIYLSASERFQRGELKDLSRTLKASQNDAGVVIHEDIGGGYYGT